MVLWLCRVSNSRPLAHQSSVLLLSQNSGLRLGGGAKLTTPHSSHWYSHRQDITGYFPTNPQVRQATPSAIESTMCGTTLGHHLWWAYESTLLTPNIVTLPSLEHSTSRIPVQRCTAKPKPDSGSGATLTTTMHSCLHRKFVYIISYENLLYLSIRFTQNALFSTDCFLE